MMAALDPTSRRSVANLSSASSFVSRNSSASSLLPSSSQLLPRPRARPAVNMDLFRSPDFSAQIKKLIDRNHVPGVAVAVAHKQDVASIAVGTASLEDSRPLTTSTLSCVGSAAKSLTAAAVAILVDDNVNYPHVQFTSTMASLLPDDFVMPGHDHDDVTVEDVLSHRTGMAPHEHSILGPNASQPDNPRSITRNLRNLSCVAENRAEHVYCNMMYTVATHLIEHVSGMSFNDFLSKHIFKPLGMNTTFLLRSSVEANGLEHRLASGYSWDRPGQRFRMLRCNEGPKSQGAGQIYATVDDYIKWVKAVMNREGPINQRIQTELTTKRIQQDPEDDSERESCTFYALGWQVHEYGGYTIVSHDGAEPGYQCNHFFILELSFGGVIMANSDQADTTLSLLMYKLIDELVHASLSSGSNSADDTESDSGSASGSASGSDDDFDMEEELRQDLAPGMGEPEPQKLPLSAYTGLYHHPGYHSLRVEDKDGVLFVDGSDRSYGFTLTMKHICGQSKYKLGFLSLSSAASSAPHGAIFEFCTVHRQRSKSTQWFVCSMEEALTNVAVHTRLKGDGVRFWVRGECQPFPSPCQQTPKTQISSRVTQRQISVTSLLQAGNRAGARARAPDVQGPVRRAVKPLPSL